MDARGYGHVEVLEQGVGAQFMQGGLFDHEIEYAFEHFTFKGLPEGISPLTRVGVFDVESFCQQYPEKARPDRGQPGRAEMAIQIVERLKELQEIFPGHFVVVEPPQAARPWPGYDEEPAEEVLKLQERLQMEPGIIRAYEEENQVRSEIMYAMLTLEGNLEVAAKYADDDPEGEVPPTDITTEDGEPKDEPAPEGKSAADQIEGDPEFVVEA